MIEIQRATADDAAELTAIQARTFRDDNKRKPPGCSLEGPPGYDSVEWNAARMAETPYFKIVSGARLVGGIIVFDMGHGHYELGRIYVDPPFQDRGIGQAAMRQLFDAFPKARKWTLGTPSWAVRNQHFYKELGFVVVRETRSTPTWAGREWNMRNAGHEIQEIVDRETRAWDTQDVDLLLSVFHPDMVWPWPPTNGDHDPVTWVMVLGKFDPERWRQFYRQFFREHTLVRNKRETIKIEVSRQGDGALAVVDVDTLWIDGAGHQDHWRGRVCKVYAKVDGAWKMTMHTGVLLY